MYSWGELKKIKSIEIGKQDSPDKAFLVNTLLHEYFEAEILKNQYTKKNPCLHSVANNDIMSSPQ